MMLWLNATIYSLWVLHMDNLKENVINKQIKPTEKTFPPASSDVSGKDFSEWKIGDYVGNIDLKITAIYGVTSSFILYRVNQSHEADYRHKLMECSLLQAGISRYEEYMGKISMANIGVYKYQLYRQTISCLAQLFRKSHMLTIGEDEKAHDFDIDKEVSKIFEPLSEQLSSVKSKISEVLSFGPKHSIYLNKKGKIHFVYDSSNEDKKLAKSILKFRLLEGLVDLLHGDQEKKFATKQLGAALDMCISSHVTNQDYCIDVAFEKIERFISERQISSIRYKFLKACFSFTLLSTLMLLAVLNQLSTGYGIFFYCMIAALVGSFVSVLQRHSSLVLDPFANSSSLFSEALCRMTIGICFGLFIVFLSKSELALAPFKDAPFALITFAFISGFSERFIPDIVTNVVSSSIKS